MANPVRITFLGGLGEIGRNCAAFELDGRIVLLDCGLMFPEADMLGVDLVLPDFTWLRENADRVDGCVLSHGHEDHVGALSFLLRELSFPIYGSALSLGIARNRIEEAGLLQRTEFIAVEDGERRRIGPFDVEFIPVTHSVPDGFATAWHTPQGVILHSGDWKLDLTPVDGRTTDLARIGQIAASSGIRLLMADSTNAEEEGHTRSERSIGASLRSLFASARGQRIITACFASHIHRIQQIADVALAEGRMVATLGLSMKKNVRLAREMGLLRIPDRHLRDIDDVGDLPPGKVCIISTGSQGEPLSALRRMAYRDHPQVELRAGDTVVFSATPIPGNERAVNDTIDRLYHVGADVVTTQDAPIHASGHGYQEELKLMLNLTKPRYVMPVHGDFKRMMLHGRLAEAVGVDPANVFRIENGQPLEIDAKGARLGDRVQSGMIFVDGVDIGDVTDVALRDRRMLSADGIFIIVATVSEQDGSSVVPPEVIARGVPFLDGNGAFVDELREAVEDALDRAAEQRITEIDQLQAMLHDDLAGFIYARLKRRPMVLPVVVEV